MEKLKTPKTPKYEVLKTETQYALYSEVQTLFGGNARNFVCEGTREFCEGIKSRLEN